MVLDCKHDVFLIRVLYRWMRWIVLSNSPGTTLRCLRQPFSAKLHVPLANCHNIISVGSTIRVHPPNVALIKSLDKHAKEDPVYQSRDPTITSLFALVTSLLDSLGGGSERERHASSRHVAYASRFRFT
jgi:hypothetical protein